MSTRILSQLLVLATVSLPLLARAETFRELANQLVDLMAFAFPMLLSLLILVFFWGIVRFVQARSSGNDKQADEGKKFMSWGLIGIFVLVSVWGFVFYFIDFFFGGALETAPPQPRYF